MPHCTEEDNRAGPRIACNQPLHFECLAQRGTARCPLQTSCRSGSSTCCEIASTCRPQERILYQICHLTAHPRLMTEDLTSLLCRLAKARRPKRKNLRRAEVDGRNRRILRGGRQILFSKQPARFRALCTVSLLFQCAGNVTSVTITQIDWLAHHGVFGADNCDQTRCGDIYTQ